MRTLPLGHWPNLYNDQYLYLRILFYSLRICKTNLRRAKAAATLPPPPFPNPVLALPANASASDSLIGAEGKAEAGRACGVCEEGGLSVLG